METIDINKVAGLQALDSEGNVLGVVSMEQLTDMVAGKLATELAAQNTAPAMRTMSLTASPAAASVAATGVDKTEGQLGDVTDPGYVRVLDKNGNSGKQGISQFASVVGGLIEQNSITLQTTSATKTWKVTASKYISGAILDIVADAGGNQLSVLRAYHSHVNNTIYVSRLSNNTNNIVSKAYHKMENGNNEFYITLTDWGLCRLLPVYPVGITYSVQEVSGFDNSGYNEV